MIVKENSVRIELTKEEMAIIHEALNIIDSLRDKLDDLDNEGKDWIVDNCDDDIETIYALGNVASNIVF